MFHGVLRVIPTSLFYYHFLAHLSQRLKVRYCDHSPSVVVVGGGVIRLILYQNCSSRLDSSKKTRPPGGGAYFPYIRIYIENFKNLLVRNHWTDFNIILQKCSFGDPLPRLFKPFGFVKKHGRQEAWLIFAIYLYRKL